MRTEALYLDDIWHAATQEVPLLREQIAAILAAEFPDEESPTQSD